MRTVFDEALTLVLVHEGGYVNHRADPGGPTNLGVTLATARRLGIDVDGDGDTDITDIKKLTPKHAGIVYRANYWDAVRGDDLPAGVDYATFDFAVNSGPSRAAKFLQRALGVKADGTIGPITLDAVHAADPVEVITKLCAARLKWLKTLSTWGTFRNGWSRRVKEVGSAAAGMVARYGKLPHDLVQPVPPPPDIEPAVKRERPPASALWRLWPILIAAALGAAFFMLK